MLSISNLTTSYEKNVVHEGLDLTLEEKKIHGIMGINGAGKTTLLNVIYGLKSPDSGAITWKGNPMLPPLIGYLDTNNYFYSRITAWEYLRLFQIKNPGFDIEEWNKIFELPLHDLIDTYSSGMQKKLALLGILGLDRPILMLDEPFNNLDIETNHILKNILKMIAESGKTIIVTSHILESLTVLCDKIHHLGNRVIIKTYEQSQFGDIEKEILSGAMEGKMKVAGGIIGKKK